MHWWINSYIFTSDKQLLKLYFYSPWELNLFEGIGIVLKKRKKEKNIYVSISLKKQKKKILRMSVPRQQKEQK